MWHLSCSPPGLHGWLFLRGFLAPQIPQDSWEHTYVGNAACGRKFAELNRAELEFQSVHSSDSSLRQNYPANWLCCCFSKRVRSTVCVAPIVYQGYKHVWCVWPREGPHVVALCRGLWAQSYCVRHVPMQEAAIHWTPAETIPFASSIFKNSKDTHHAWKGPFELQSQCRWTSEKSLLCFPVPLSPFYLTCE